MVKLWLLDIFRSFFLKNRPQTIVSGENLEKMSRGQSLTIDLRKHYFFWVLKCLVNVPKMFPIQNVKRSHPGSYSNKWHGTRVQCIYIWWYGSVICIVNKVLVISISLISGEVAPNEFPPSITITGVSRFGSSGWRGANTQKDGALEPQSTL